MVWALILHSGLAGCPNETTSHCVLPLACQLFQTSTPVSSTLPSLLYRHGFVQTTTIWVFAHFLREAFRNHPRDRFTENRLSCIFSRLSLQVSCLLRTFFQDRLHLADFTILVGKHLACCPHPRNKTTNRSVTARNRTWFSHAHVKHLMPPTTVLWTATCISPHALTWKPKFTKPVIYDTYLDPQHWWHSRAPDTRLIYPNN